MLIRDRHTHTHTKKNSLIETKTFCKSFESNPVESLVGIGKNNLKQVH